MQNREKKGQNRGGGELQNRGTKRAEPEDNWKDPKYVTGEE